MWRDARWEIRLIMFDGVLVDDNNNLARPHIPIERCEDISDVVEAICQ